MDVILLKDVEKLGLRGDVVDVARGYARNYLLPREARRAATPARVAELEKRRRPARPARGRRRFEQAQEIAERLGEAELRFDVNAGPTGALFGSVTATDIADEIWRDVEDPRRPPEDRPARPDQADRRCHAIPVEIFTDVTAEVRTLVVPEGGELPPEEELDGDGGRQRQQPPRKRRPRPPRQQPRLTVEAEVEQSSWPRKRPSSLTRKRPKPRRPRRGCGEPNPKSRSSTRDAEPS